MILAPGTQVTPNVRLLSPLGQGGMGSVWVAEHLSLQTNVAVKFVSAELLQHDPSLLERFNREAALSAKIKSPHVVQIFDHGVMEGGRPYIVMELLEGETLSERIERRGPLTAGEVSLVLAQTAKALGKAHKSGVVHRDIKSDNLFLVGDRDDDEIFLKVLDFGIAKQSGLPQAASVTTTGTMIGTPEFMSPEQVLSSKSVDHRADLWALGIVAYHALTGDVPFRGETLGSLCVAIAAGRFQPVTVVRTGLPSALDAWFQKALASDPEARFQSAKELADGFARALDPSFLPRPAPSLDDESTGGHRAVSSAVPVRVQPVAVADTVATGVAPPHAVQSSTFTGAAMSSGEVARPGRVAAFAALAVVGMLAGGGAGLYFLTSGSAAAPTSAASIAPAASDVPTAEPAASAPVETPPPAASSAAVAETPPDPTPQPSAAPATTVKRSATGTTKTTKTSDTDKKAGAGGKTGKPDRYGF